MTTYQVTQTTKQVEEKMTSVETQLKEVGQQIEQLLNECSAAEYIIFFEEGALDEFPCGLPLNFVFHHWFGTAPDKAMMERLYKRPVKEIWLRSDWEKDQEF